MKEQRLANGEISRLCRSMALLLHAGVPLSDGIFLIAEEENTPIRSMLEQMGSLIDGGDSLGQSLEQIGCFPAYAEGMIRVGEQTGRLEEVLNALASYYETRERMNRQIRMSLTYPSVLLMLMLVIIGVLLIWVLPVFDEVYASLGGQLTGLGGGLLKLGEFLKASLPV